MQEKKPKQKELRQKIAAKSNKLKRIIKKVEKKRRPKRIVVEAIFFFVCLFVLYACE